MQYDLYGSVLECPADSQLTFMASYSIVLAPIAAMMAFDFFIIKHGKLDIYELYKPHGIYRFAKGWNWRAYVALVVAVVPNLPGMINTIEPRVSLAILLVINCGIHRG